MRDDIYKLAPLSHPMKRVVKACQRDADWELGGVRMAEEAARKFLRKELSPSLIQLLQDIDGKPAMLTKAEEISMIPEYDLNPWEKHLINYSRLAVDLSGSFLDRAVADLLEEYSLAALPRLDRHLARYFPKQRAEMMRRFRESHLQVPVDSICSDLRSGNFRTSVPSKVPALGQDDDVMRVSD